jgi:hypothetical protein
MNHAQAFALVMVESPKGDSMTVLFSVAELVRLVESLEGLDCLRCAYHQTQFNHRVLEMSHRPSTKLRVSDDD